MRPPHIAAAVVLLAGPVDADAIVLLNAGGGMVVCVGKGKHAIVVVVQDKIVAGGIKPVRATEVPLKTGHAGVDVGIVPGRNADRGVVNMKRGANSILPPIPDKVVYGSGVGASDQHQQPAAVAVAAVVGRLAVADTVMPRLLSVFLANPLCISVAALRALRRRITAGKCQPARSNQPGQDAENGNLAQPEPRR